MREGLLYTVQQVANGDDHKRKKKQWKGAGAREDVSPPPLIKDQISGNAF